MKHISTLVLLACLATCLISCVTDQAHRLYIDTPLTSKSPSEVSILLEAPSRPYKIIADFQARGAKLKYMQKKAAEIGADAVICTPIGGLRSYKDEWASQDTSQTYYRLAGTAIIYTD